MQLAVPPSCSEAVLLSLEGLHPAGWSPSLPHSRENVKERRWLCLMSHSTHSMMSSTRDLEDEEAAPLSSGPHHNPDDACPGGQLQVGGSKRSRLGSLSSPLSLQGKRDGWQLHRSQGRTSPNLEIRCQAVSGSSATICQSRKSPIRTQNLWWGNVGQANPPQSGLWNKMESISPRLG